MNSTDPILLNEEILMEWERSYLPPFDLFFFSSLELAKELMGNLCLIMSKQEFTHHSDYNQVQTVNSYTLWGISSTASHVCVAPPDLFPSLPLEVQQIILQEQKSLNRGLLFEWDKISTIIQEFSHDMQEFFHETFTPYKILVENQSFIALQSKIWSQLPSKFKHLLLKNEAQEYREHEIKVDGEFLYQLAKNYPHIAPYFNLYPSKSGPNCFAATLGAIINQEQYSEWMLTNWVHPDGFLNTVSSHGYKPIIIDLKDTLPKDVFVWKNGEGQIQHASFHLQDEYFFNKDGQSFFNAWEIVNIEYLLSNWGRKGLQIYRREDEDKGVYGYLKKWFKG